MSVQISSAGKTRMNAWLDGNRNPNQAATVGQILTWFVEQKPIVQQVVLGHVPPEMKASYAAALRAMASSVEDGPDMEHASVIRNGKPPNNHAAEPKPSANPRKHTKK